MLPLAVQAAMAAIEKICPEAKNLLVVPENTRNTFYLSNIAQLQKIFRMAGLNVRVGSIDPDLKKATTVDLPGGDTVTLEPVVRSKRRLGLKNFDPCTILLNNDLTAGPPGILEDLHEQYLLPPLHAGWSVRRKSRHFQSYEEVAKRFGKMLGIDSWLVNPMFNRCGELDFFKEEGMDCLRTNVDALLTRIRKKYKEYGINEKPFVIVKDDHGTHGMGIMTVRDVKDLELLRERPKNKPPVGKTGQAITDVIIQEGVLTAERINDAVAEPVVYLMDRYVVGGFYRVHAERGSDENLNAPGSLSSAGFRRVRAYLSPVRSRVPARPTASTCTASSGAMALASYELGRSRSRGATTNRACLSCCTATSRGARAAPRTIAVPKVKTPPAALGRDGAVRAELEIIACGADHRRHRCRLWRHRHQRPVRRQGSVRRGHVPFTPENVYGVLSIFFWTLTVIVSIKYVVLVLRADNNGEGGLIAMLALASQAVKDKPKLRQCCWQGIFGTSLFYGDGVITPAISVLSAVEGLEVVSPRFAEWVIPLTLVILFACSPCRSGAPAASASSSGPSRWSGSRPSRCWASRTSSTIPILKALKPYYALQFMWQQPGTTFIILGAVVLCVTGAEALYADLGHFGKKPIRLAWFTVVMPALTLNYFGQGALLLARLRR